MRSAAAMRGVWPTFGCVLRSMNIATGSAVSGPCTTPPISNLANTFSDTPTSLFSVHFPFSLSYALTNTLSLTFSFYRKLV